MHPQYYVHKIRVDRVHAEERQRFMNILAGLFGDQFEWDKGGETQEQWYARQDEEYLERIQHAVLDASKAELHQIYRSVRTHRLAYLIQSFIRISTVPEVVVIHFGQNGELDL